MEFEEQLRVLLAAQGDPAKLALSTVDLEYRALPVPERAALRDAVEAAAIPHWCDAEILAALLETFPDAVTERMSRLRSLRIVEPFLARGETAFNVHETTRLALRKAMERDHPLRFRQLSGRAGAYFSTDSSPSGRIEWVYHRLCAEPDRAFQELEALNRVWYDTAWPESRQALVAAMTELESGGFLSGKARIEALLCRLETQVSRDDFEHVEEAADLVLELARAEDDASAEARALCVKGDFHFTKGDLAEAASEFEGYLRIYGKLSDEDPGNVRWKRGLVVVGHRAGEVRQRQGRFPEAETIFAEAERMASDLEAREPDEPGWKLLVAGSSLIAGGLLTMQGKLTEANASYQKALAIQLNVVERDPKNASLLAILGVTHSRIGDFWRDLGDLEAAQHAFREFLEIARRLAEEDPRNLRLRSDLVQARLRVGELQQAQGNLAAARSTFEMAVSDVRGLADLDADMGGWQHALSSAHKGIGDVLMSEGEPQAALIEFQESFRIVQSLAGRAPDDAALQQELQVVQERLESARRSLQ